MDVFLGLGCEKSARAWPILKRAASDQRNRVDFVFHILPVSDDPIVFSAATVRAEGVLVAPWTKNHESWCDKGAGGNRFSHANQSTNRGMTNVRTAISFSNANSLGVETREMPGRSSWATRCQRRLFLASTQPSPVNIPYIIGGASSPGLRRRNV